MVSAVLMATFHSRNSTENIRFEPTTSPTGRNTPPSRRQQRRQLLQTQACRECNLSGMDLRGYDLAEANLVGANLSRSRLSGTNLARANLAGANLGRAVLEDTDLRRATLTNADLTGAFFARTDMRGADLTNARFTNADLLRGKSGPSHYPIHTDDTTTLPDGTQPISTLALGRLCDRPGHASLDSAAPYPAADGQPAYVMAFYRPDGSAPRSWAERTPGGFRLLSARAEYTISQSRTRSNSGDLHAREPTTAPIGRYIPADSLAPRNAAVALVLCVDGHQTEAHPCDELRQFVTKHHRATQITLIAAQSGQVVDTQTITTEPSGQCPTGNVPAGLPPFTVDSYAAFPPEEAVQRWLSDVLQSPANP